MEIPVLVDLSISDAALFANVPAQAACAIDCAKAIQAFPFSRLYWCAGCHGTIYPLSGWMGGHYSPIQASKLMVARMQAKMHRDLVAWRASGRCDMWLQISARDGQGQLQTFHDLPNFCKKYNEML